MSPVARKKGSRVETEINSGDRLASAVSRPFSTLPKIAHVLSLLRRESHAANAPLRGGGQTRLSIRRASAIAPPNPARRRPRRERDRPGTANWVGSQGFVDPVPWPSLHV